MMREIESRTKLILLCGLGAVVCVYAFYFLYLPQSWGLMDDYSGLRHWGSAGFRPVDEGFRFLKDLMSVGRFRPLDAAARMLRYKFLPVTPRAFHASQFALAAAALAALGVFLRNMGLGAAQILLGVFLAAMNLSMKEWLVYTTAAEGLATAFLMAAAALYTSRAKGGRWLAVPIFVCAFLSKESFCVMLGLFAAIEAFRPGGGIRSARRWFPVLAMGLSVVAFTLFMRSLPRQYASGMGVAKLTVAGVLVAIAMPLLKSYLPALLLAGYSFVSKGKRAALRERRGLMLAGLATALPYTVVLAAWGPFDSWFYLHIPIPFGWAIFLAAAWRPDFSRAEAALLGLLVAFGLFAALNGSRNLHGYFADAKTVADAVCEDAQRTPGLRAFSNCEEGSLQLGKYLALTAECPNPPRLTYLNRAPALPAGIAAPYDVLISAKCDPFDATGLERTRTVRLNYWTIYKNVK